MTDNFFISVGIDVGADFSFMSIALPNQTFAGKPFKITHSNLNSLETSVLKVSFPKYLGIFSKITTTTSLAFLEKYSSPDLLLSARKSSVIKLIKTTARFGDDYAETQYSKLLSAAKSAKIFGHSLPSDSELIRLYISLIKTYDNVADSVLKSIQI